MVRPVTKRIPNFHSIYMCPVADYKKHASDSNLAYIKVGLYLSQQ